MPQPPPYLYKNKEMIYIYYILHIIYIYLSPYPSFGYTRARARGVTLGGGGF